MRETAQVAHNKTRGRRRVQTKTEGTDIGSRKKVILILIALILITALVFGASRFFASRLAESGFSPAGRSTPAMFSVKGDAFSV